MLFKNPKLIKDRDELLRTGLHWASKRNLTEVTKILLDFGGDPKVIDSLEKNSIDYAKDNCYMRTLRLMNALVRGRLKPEKKKYDDPLYLDAIVKAP